MDYDVLIIGAGITGASIAFELSKFEIDVAVIEKENDVSMMTTKANSGIVHAGYDPLPSTKMAKLNVLGNALIHELYPLMNFAFDPCGSLVVGKTLEEHQKINELYERGLKNHVPGLKILKTKEEVHQVEPYLDADIDYALYAKTAGIVSPWELCLALSYNAKTNGVDFFFDSKVCDIERVEDRYLVKTDKGEFRGKYVINCAGLFADDIYRMALKGKGECFDITPVKGEYFLLDKEQGYLASKVIFQCPNQLGKGVLVTKTVHGNLLVGPNAIETGDKEDTSTRASSLDFIRMTSKKSVDKVNFMANIRNFSGERATIAGMDDFYIEESEYLHHFINFAGIKSPGLTSGPAFGVEAREMLEKSGLSMKKKAEYRYYRMKTHFRDLSLKEKEKLIKEDPRYGQIICRCETVSEGEIIDALHAPIPARSIDGVKRRCNAGMGRCQGGFCSPKVSHLLMKELGLGYNEVYQDKEGSSILVSRTKEDR